MIPPHHIPFLKLQIDFTRKAVIAPLVELAQKHGDGDVEDELLIAAVRLNQAYNILVYRLGVKHLADAPAEHRAFSPEGFPL